MVTRILISDKPRQPAHKFARRSLGIGPGCVFSRWEGKDSGTGTRLRAGVLRACLKSPDSCIRPDQSPANNRPPAWSDSATQHGTVSGEGRDFFSALQVPCPQRSVIRRREGAAPVVSLRIRIREAHSRWSHRSKGDKRQELNSLRRNSKLAVSKKALYSYSAYPA